LLIIRVAADHPIECDDVRIWYGGRGLPDIGMDELDSSDVPPPPRLLFGGLQEGGRRFHFAGPRYAVIQQLVVERADAPADVEEGSLGRQVRPQA
jgi:hypothetical protein